MALGVHVGKEDFPAGLGQSGGEVNADGGLAATTLLVDYRNGSHNPSTRTYNLKFHWTTLSSWILSTRLIESSLSQQ